MVWNPQYTVINSRAIADNLLTYFATNQADALTWAGGGSLKPFRKFSNSIANRAVPVYPAIAFSDDNDAVDYTGDVTEGAYSLTFEVSIDKATANDSNAADTVVTDARLYAIAIVSMIRNCPLATLAANTGALAGGTVIETIECGFDPIRSNDARNEFLQVFQVRTVFRLMQGFDE